MNDRDVRDLSNLFQEILDHRLFLRERKRELEAEVERLSELVDELATNLEIAENKLKAIEEAGL